MESKSFACWAEECLPLLRHGIKSNTYHNNYVVPLETHLLPYFGEVALQGIKTSMVRQFIIAKEPDCSRGSIRKMLTCLSVLMEYALDDGLIARNPVIRNLKINSEIAPAKKLTWTREQYNTAWQFALGHPDGVHIMTLMETGITRSELLGIQREDFNRSRQTLFIRNGLVECKDPLTGRWELMHDGLKNRYRTREIPLSSNLAESIFLQSRAILLPSGAIFRPDYIFHARLGGGYSPSNWDRRLFAPFMHALHEAHPEVPRLSPHELRHTRATLLYEQGVDPMAIAHMLGHADLRMQMQCYTHISADALREKLQI